MKRNINNTHDKGCRPATSIMSGEKSVENKESRYGILKKFALAQLQLALILSIAFLGDRFEPSYPRNDNHNITLFWILHAILLLATICTWKHKPRDKVTLLSREQTEEWKGWMQFSFIMYHYYRARPAYNWIRVFVSSYVWMTGFGNFLYFEKKKDFSLQRIVSMCIRINYFPILLSLATGVSLDLYYVVPLHTIGFFMTLVTCFLSQKLEYQMGYWRSRIVAITIITIAHILFYETKAVELLLFFSTEIHLRFQMDKYSALIGVISGLCMKKATEYISWAYGDVHKTRVQIKQCLLGILLIAGWYIAYGYIPDKLVYNPIHPYIFLLPMFGWLLIRNSSRYLMEHHSTFLEFLGRNTLETYVLQFHLFMNHSVQHIPIVIPGSGSDGHIVLRTLNMLLCGIIFLLVAIWARNVTVTTQTTVLDLMKINERKDYALVSTEEVEITGNVSNRITTPQNVRDNKV